MTTSTPAGVAALHATTRVAGRDLLRGLLRRLRVDVHKLAAVTRHERQGVHVLASVSNDMERLRWEEVLSGRKEPEVLEWIERELRAGEVLVDIGANVGNYAVYAALRHPGLRVFAFEPEPHSLSQLLENVRLNQADVRCLQIPLCEAPRFSYLNLHAASTAGYSQHQFGRTRTDRGRDFVPAGSVGLLGSSLDALVEQGVVPAPTHIKLDVDGLEELVLTGMQRVLAGGTVRSLCVELNGSPEAVGRQAALIERHGYRRTLGPAPEEGFNSGNHVFLAG